MSASARAQLDRIVATRQRCHACRSRRGVPKVKWDSRAQAEEIIALMRRTRRHPDAWRPIHCASCHAWHITSARTPPDAGDTP